MTISPKRIEYSYHAVRRVLEKGIMPFWLDRGWDDEHGGYLTNFDENGAGVAHPGEVFQHPGPTGMVVFNPIPPLSQPGRIQKISFRRGGLAARILLGPTIWWLVLEGQS